MRGGDVDRLDVGAELLREPLRHLAEPAADVEHALGLLLGDRVVGDVLGVAAVEQRVEDRGALREALLARVLPANEQWVVELHGVRIGCPGIPRDGAFPLSQAFTVAPTSANSPSWICPDALWPATYASSIACSREWSVDGVVGSQP